MQGLKEYVYDIIRLPNYIYNRINLRLYRVKCGKIKINGRIRFHGFGCYEFGSCIQINSMPMLGNPVGINQRTHLCAYDDAVLKIGDNVGISGATIVAHISITIEQDVLIGGGVQIFDTDFHSVYYDERIKNQGAISKPVVIKKGVFIGAESIILKGVTIGQGSVIGAGSVVTKDIPEGEIWAGNPAVFVRKIISV